MAMSWPHDDDDESLHLILVRGKHISAASNMCIRFHEYFCFFFLSAEMDYVCTFILHNLQIKLIKVQPAVCFGTAASIDPCCSFS